MGKPTKRPRLATKAAKAKSDDPSPALPKASSNLPNPLTKDGKRQARHHAFLKSPPPKKALESLLMVEIHEQAPGKRIRKKRAKKPVSLLSLGSTLDEIMAEDKKARARKAEVSRPLKTGELRAERERFRAVMEHPQFKVNPLKTIREHVENVWERKEGMAL